MLNYHALTQGKSKSGAEFVDLELRKYLALRDMDVQIDDFIRLTTFIQQDTTNAKHKRLAQTIFTTPNMTLGCAASLFETYNPPSGPAAAPTTPTVNAVICRYCKGKDHILSDCPKKNQFPIRRGLKNPIRLRLLSPDQLNATDFHVLIYEFYFRHILFTKQYCLGVYDKYLHNYERIVE